VVTSPSACKRWLQQLVSKQPIKLVLHLLFEFCVQPCNQTPSSENLADLGREPIIPLLHAYNLALAGLAPWCEPGSARKTTNQALRASPRVSNIYRLKNMRLAPSQKILGSRNSLFSNSSFIFFVPKALKPAMSSLEVRCFFESMADARS